MFGNIKELTLHFNPSINPIIIQFVIGFFYAVIFVIGWYCLGVYSNNLNRY